MEFKRFIKLIIPFIVGVLVGGGLTRNKYTIYIIIAYIIFMILIQFLGGKIKRVSESANKKETLIDESFDTLNEAGKYTLKGNELGKNWFDKYYGTYIFIFNLMLAVVMLVFLFYGKWLTAFVIFITIHIHMILNQVWRRIKVNEINEAIKENGDIKSR